MFRVPAFYPDVSLKLASVLEDIGVNERMVSRGRRAALLTENMMTITHRLIGYNVSEYHFGSQVEGTTTIGLQSDSDILYSDNQFNLIQHWRDWEYGRENIMMIQDQNTPPGYCLLQKLYDNFPYPVTEIAEIGDERYARYKADMVVIKNSFFENKRLGEKNGPADTIKDECNNGVDRIYAFPCKTLPVTVRSWLDQQFIQGNISNTIKTYIERQPCFVVPVGFKYETAEWRISTSHAERCVMLNMNITQIQCYMMMKLILKTYLKHPEVTSLSSFMCKNVLLLCIEKTHSAVWRPHNLLRVFTFCLIQLRTCVEREYCPHFIVHQNNLMAGKFTPDVKHWLLDRLQTAINSNGLVFLGVEIDNFGLRYIAKLNHLNRMADMETSFLFQPIR